MRKALKLARREIVEQYSDRGAAFRALFFVALPIALIFLNRGTGGRSPDPILLIFALQAALLPTATLVFMQLGMVVSGAVTVEAVFSWPGLGQLTYDALHGPDLPVLQGVFTVLASAVVLMNLLAELLYRALDPRVRTS